MSVYKAALILFAMVAGLHYAKASEQTCFEAYEDKQWFLPSEICFEEMIISGDHKTVQVKGSSILPANISLSATYERDGGATEMFGAVELSSEDGDFCQEKKNVVLHFVALSDDSGHVYPESIGMGLVWSHQNDSCHSDEVSGVTPYKLK